MYKPYLLWGPREEKPQKSSGGPSASREKDRPQGSGTLAPRRLPNPWFTLSVLCPPIARGKRYLLVERTWWGQREVLKAGRARSPHENLNLARVRHTAARLGATEVHILPSQ